MLANMVIMGQWKITNSQSVNIFFPKTFKARPSPMLMFSISCIHNFAFPLDELVSFSVDCSCFVHYMGKRMWTPDHQTHMWFFPKLYTDLKHKIVYNFFPAWQCPCEPSKLHEDIAGQGWRIWDWNTFSFAKFHRTSQVEPLL